VQGKGELVLGAKAVALPQRPPASIEMTDGQSALQQTERLGKEMQGKEWNEGNKMEARSIGWSKSIFFSYCMNVAVKIQNA
jgi:hypothetical protein